MTRASQPALRLGELFRYRARGVSWAEHAVALSDLARALDSPPDVTSAVPTVVVLPVFGRPQTMALSVDLALATPGVTQVLVLVNDPNLDLDRWLGRRDSKLTVVVAPERRGPVERYRALAAQAGEYFFSMDDDVFLHPRQIHALMRSLRDYPDSPQGFYGQHFDPTARRFSQSVVRRTGSVSVLNRAYAFTREHLERYLSLLGPLGVDAGGIDLEDDIVLSFAGRALPIVWDLGPYVDSRSEARRGVARWSRPDAQAIRRELFERLREGYGLPPLGRPKAIQPPPDRRGRTPLTSLFDGLRPSTWLSKFPSLARRQE